MLEPVDSATPKPGEMALADASGALPAVALPAMVEVAALPAALRDELWQRAQAGTAGLGADEFGAVLAHVGRRLNFGLPEGVAATAHKVAAFYDGLRLEELALAHGCARGKEPAWERFVARYKGFLVKAAIAITGSSSLGEEIADSLYAELWGLRERDGQRTSPFASYTGRGSLEGWLRTTLVQRWRDHYRKSRREEPLEHVEPAAPAAAAGIPVEPGALATAVAGALGGIGAEDRFLLAAYYLDQQTLLQIARTLHVHEATISRRLARLVKEIRKKLLEKLVNCGLSRRAAEEALGADPRDVEINLRALLQTTQSAPFQEKGPATATSGDS